MLHRNPIVTVAGLHSAAMNLFDTPAGFDDPIGMWMGCHRRIEKQLATLAKLAAHLADVGIDAEASSAAQSVLRYFEKSGPHHHEDEDRDLFPLLEKRISDAADLARFRELRTRLEADHRQMESGWARLRKPLHGIAEGIPKALEKADVEAFRAVYASHIPAEDGAIPDLAKRYLSPADLESLGRAMAARRGVAYPA
jgi:hemerythrin-like domain-containing protein